MSSRAPVRDGGTTSRHSKCGYRPRLLAGLLPVGSDPRPHRSRCPGARVHRGTHDAAPPASARRSPVCGARLPAANMRANRIASCRGARERGDRRELDDRGRPRRARARAGRARGSSVIPNPVDIAAIRAMPTRDAAAARRTAMRFTCGKLADQQGRGSPGLPSAAQLTARLSWSATDLRDRRGAARASARDVRFDRMAGQDEPRAWMAHASAARLPSRGPESLSRVLLEASALGMPIAAMNTGGTADIVERRADRPAFAAPPTRSARRPARSGGDRSLRRALGAAARAHAEKRSTRRCRRARRSALPRAHRAPRV